MRFLSFDVGVKNLGYCVIVDSYRNGDVDDVIYVESWGVLDISVCVDDSDSKTKTKTKPSLSDSTMKILETLEENFGSKGLEFDHVVIENQPCLKNPTMKTVQITIFTYFHILRMQMQDNGGKSKIGEICMANASNKLKIGALLDHNHKSEELVEWESKPKKYNRTKKLSVLYTKHIIENNEEMKIKFNNDCLEAFNEKKKQDDMSDALLQILVHHHRHYKLFCI